MCWMDRRQQGLPILCGCLPKTTWQTSVVYLQFLWPDLSCPNRKYDWPWKLWLSEICRTRKRRDAERSLCNAALYRAPAANIRRTPLFLGWRPLKTETLSTWPDYCIRVPWMFKLHGWNNAWNDKKYDDLKKTTNLYSIWWNIYNVWYKKYDTYHDVHTRYTWMTSWRDFSFTIRASWRWRLHIHWVEH